MRAVVSTTSLLFAATLYFSILSMVDSRATVWFCNPCMSFSECNAEPVEFCPWGETRNACNRRVCAKGPGERCGGQRDILGKCGTGMWCDLEEDSNAHTCHGCYANSLECHNSKRYV